MTTPYEPQGEQPRGTEPNYGPPPGAPQQYGYPQPSGYAPPPGYPPQYGYAPPGYAPPGYPPQPPGYLNPYAHMVKRPLAWFIVTWILFWPLGIYSTVSAWQNIDPALAWGDIATAQRHADRVKKIGIISVCVVGGVYLLMFAVFGALVAAAPG